MRHLMNSPQISERIASAKPNKPLEESLLLLKKSSVGSLGAADREQFDSYDLQKFLCMSRQSEKYSARGNESFPETMLTPKRNVLLLKNLQDLLVKYYQRAYEDLPVEF